MGALKSKDVEQPSIGQLLECRGSTWRFLGEERGFWHLDLVKEGAQFAEIPIRVWALPQLEVGTIKLLKDSDALAPAPGTHQRTTGKNFKPFLQARRNHALQDSEDSSQPHTALHCAIEHKPWQFDPWHRIVTELPFPRLLIADDVGLGKTTEAAIILAELTRRRRAERILIIAPQHLTEKWQDELYERFGLAFEIYNRETRMRLSDRGVKNPWEMVERVIVSRDFVKRWENLRALENVTWDMVVIDECHHFVKDKNEAPTRLRELAEKIVYTSPGLLLLSATPFTGSKAEFHSLLKLLDPKFQDASFAAKWDSSNPYLIRRLKGHVKDKGEKIQDRKIIEVKITEQDLAKAEQNLLKSVATCLAECRTSPDSESWDRLIEETARKRLSSSWEAFYDTIMGSERMSSWFPDGVKSNIKKIIEQKAGGKLRSLANTIKSIHAASNGSKIVIFTEAIPSQNAIAQYLVESCGYTAKEVATIRANTPRDERLQIEDNFANPDSDLKVLIATDTISEGKDLQHACNHLIHYELPWSLVKIEQRNGRIDRLGQDKTSFIYNLVFDTQATPDQKVLDRLIQKLERAKDALGSVSPIIAAYDNLRSEDLLEGDAEARLEHELDAKAEDAESFGFGLTSLTSLSSSPHLDESDFDGRRQNLMVMLVSLVGKLDVYGQTDDQFLLSLPDNPTWELPGLVSLGEPYPSFEKPWRVTFNPATYLSYETYRRKHGEGREPLRFISPVHPVALQIESRFRNRLAESGYPIFRVDNAAHDHVIIVELTARSPSSRILAQRLTAIELKGFAEIPLDVLNADLRGVEGPVDLPAAKTWKQVEAKLTGISAQYVQSLKQSYDQRKTSLTSEQNAISQETFGKDARAAWIDDLWTVDGNQKQFQILALLVAKR